MAEKVEERVRYAPIGFLNILFFIFLFLKLGELGTVKHWSWWTVTSPLWVPVVAMAGILLLLSLAFLVLKTLDAFCEFMKK